MTNVNMDNAELILLNLYENKILSLVDSMTLADSVTSINGDLKFKMFIVTV